jgi:hypothetical protein
MDPRGQSWFDYEVLPTRLGKEVLGPLVQAGTAMGTSMVCDILYYRDDQKKPNIIRRLTIYTNDIIADAGLAESYTLPIILGSDYSLDSCAGGSASSGSQAGAGGDHRASVPTVGDVSVMVTLSRTYPGRPVSALTAYRDQLKLSRSELENALADFGAISKARQEVLWELQQADREVAEARQLLAEIAGLERELEEAYPDQQSIFEDIQQARAAD